MSTLEIGQILLKQFRIEAFVASGGMGAVYRVWDLKRNVPLAMKVLHSELAEDPSMFKRFQREANALKKLAHPNIVPFYGLSQTPDFAFMLERFIDGPSLQSVLKKNKGPLPVGEALIYLKALCAALGYAHASGVVHCDIKPGNVMIDRGGSIYLTDFGIARHAESTSTTMGAAGTPAYMAPEQIRGEAVSPATDIYALGVLLFELLTGQRPFRGTEAGTEKSGATANERIRDGHLNLQPPDPRTINPGLPPALAGAILKALNKKPQDRFRSTQEFLATVCMAAGQAERDIPERAVPPAELIKKAPLPAPEAPQQPENVRRPARWIIGGGVTLGAVCLVAALIAGIVWLGGRNVATPRPGTPTLVPPTKMATVTSQPTLIPSTPTPNATSTPAFTIGSTRERPADGMVEVYVPAGEFKMGTNDLDPQERPIHNVYLDAYWIDQTEVTNGKYAKCVGAGVCGRPANENSYTRFPYFSDPMYADYPVIRVDWKQARDYCDWADGRLPTEAEWEKAARGTSERIFPWGPANPSDKLVNYNKSFGDTTVVSKFPDGASPYGALDMAGNVWEWVNDWYDPEYYSNSPTGNPQGPPSAAKRVLRGGAWNAEGALYIKTAYRHATEDYSNTISIGFRCVRP